MRRGSAWTAVAALGITAGLLGAGTGAAQAATPPAPRSITHACPAGQAPPDGFTDVSPDAATYADVACVAWWGVTKGARAGVYDPGPAVRRDQMAGFIARLIIADGGSLPSNPPNAFTDTAGNTFQTQINQLAAVGVVNGTGGGHYDPSATVNRGEMAAFLVRAYDYRTNTTLTTSNSYFTDTAGNTFAQQINDVASVGVAGGYPDGTYRPTYPVLRIQMASFLARLLDLLVANGYGKAPASSLPGGSPYLTYSNTLTEGGAGSGYSAYIGTHDAHNDALSVGIQSDVGSTQSGGNPWFIWELVQNGTFTFSYLAPASHAATPVTLQWWSGSDTAVFFVSGNQVAQVHAVLTPRLFFTVEGDARLDGDSVHDAFTNAQVTVGSSCPTYCGLNGAWNTSSFNYYGLTATDTNGKPQNGADFTVTGTASGVPAGENWDTTPTPLGALAMIAQYWNGA